MDNNNSEEPDMKRRRTNDSSISNAGIIGIDSFSSDIAIRFASYLSSRDLVSLALTCRRFGSSNKNIKSLSLSLVETTARQIICNAKQDERDNLPANRTYIEKYNELEKYRGPLIFHQFIGKDISYVDNDKSYVKLHSDYECDMPSNTAISNHVMRAGKHYVTFTKEISTYWNS